MYHLVGFILRVACFVAPRLTVTVLVRAAPVAQKISVRIATWKEQRRAT